MKQQILASILAGACAAAASAAVTIVPGDRIDIYSTPEAFTSLLVDDIANIKYAGDATTGYTDMVVTYADGSEITFPISGINKMIYTTIDETPFEIKVVDAEHANFRMLYNYNDPNSPNPIDPTKPQGWRGGTAGMPVFFNPFPHKGYSCTYTVAGQYSGKIYTDIPGFVWEVKGEDTVQFGIGIDCLRYDMPFEPTVMTITAIERDDYAGIPILGKYHGVRISAGASHVRTGSSDEVSFEMKANTTFEIKTTEDDPIELLDCYTYDAANHSFVNVPDPDDAKQSPNYLNVKWRFSGAADSYNNMFLKAEYIPETIMENNRRYAVFPFKSTFAIADGDEYGMRSLLEVTPEQGEKQFYLFENYAASQRKVDVQFTEGSTIGTPSVAYVSYDGARQMKYIYKAGSNPVMQLKGAEAGTYTYNGTANHSSLMLDGFDTATIDGADCTYSIENGIVNINLATGSQLFIVDKTTDTYKEKPSDKWEGAKTFQWNEVTASYVGNEPQANATMTLMLDKYINGNDAPGNAAIKVEIPRPDSYNKHEMTFSGTYVYDATASTITVINAATYVIESGEYVYGRRNLTFHVGSDGKSMYLGNEGIGDYLRAARDGSYVLTGETSTIYADGKKPVAGPTVDDIVGSYSGTAVLQTSFGSATTEVTLTVTASTASIKSFAMGTNMFNSEGLNYDLEGNTLTIKDVTVGNGDMFSGLTKQVDMVFTYVDGNFQCPDETYYGNSTSTAAFATVMNGVTLTKQ